MAAVDLDRVAHEDVPLEERVACSGKLAKSSRLRWSGLQDLAQVGRAQLVGRPSATLIALVHYRPQPQFPELAFAKGAGAGGTRKRSSSSLWLARRPGAAPPAAGLAARRHQWRQIKLARGPRRCRGVVSRSRTTTSRTPRGSGCARSPWRGPPGRRCRTRRRPTSSSGGTTTVSSISGLPLQKLLPRTVFIL